MDDEKPQENTWTLTIKSLSKRKEVSIPADCKVEKLREEASKIFEIEPSQTNLIFGGKILKDEENLKDHGIGAKSTVHLVIRHKKVDAPKALDSEASPPRSFPDQQAGAGSIPASPFGAFANMPFGNSNFNEVQQNLYRTLQTDPNAVQNLLSNPMVQGLMSNPDLLRSIMLNNPQMQRVIEQNPEVSQFFNNPDFMRQTMEMIRNPTTLQEIMRNHDRALINLESLPGGYNALQRIYRDFQEPMLNATQEQFGYNPLTATSNSSAPASTSQIGTENTDPLPNPWASQSSTTQSDIPQFIPTAQQSSSAANASPMVNNHQMHQLLMDAAENPRMLSNMLRSSQTNPMFENYIRDPRILRNLIDANPLIRNDPQLRDQMHRSIHTFLNQWSLPEIRALYSNQEALSAMLQIQQGFIRLRNAAPEIFSRIASTPLSSTLGSSILGDHNSTSTPAASPVTPQASSTVQAPPQADSMNAASPLIPNPVQTTTTPASTTTGSQQNSNQDYTTSLFQLLNILSPQQNQQTAQSPVIPPEQQYASELEQMRTMGFHNRDANLRALVASMGDVNLAVERILEQQQNYRQNP